MTKAIAYLRTSSATNVKHAEKANAGEIYKDSEERQRIAITNFASANGYEIVDEFYDAAVSGADPIEARNGFAAMLDRIEGNGVRVVIVEDASRFARDIMVQELGLMLMIKRGCKVITASGDVLTDDGDDKMRKMFRVMAGMFAEIEKHRLVKKMQGARDRKSAELGRRVEGQKGYDVQSHPELYEAARAIKQAMPAASLRTMAAEFSRRGFKTASGLEFSANQVSLIMKRI
jgi:DNA invertase Pin-like site-specific DNA recombinase